MNSERELFLDAVASKNWIDKQSIEKDYKFSDGKFIALKRDDIEYADWLNIGWEMWQASAQRQGYNLVHVEPTYKQLDALKNSCELFRKAGVSDLEAHGAYKAMIGAVDEI